MACIRGLTVVWNLSLATGNPVYLCSTTQELNTISFLMYFCLELWVTSIWRCYLSLNRIPIKKIRHSHNHLIFIAGCPILGKTLFILKQGPSHFNLSSFMGMIYPGSSEPWRMLVTYNQNCYYNSNKQSRVNSRTCFSGWVVYFVTVVAWLWSV